MTKTSISCGKNGPLVVKGLSNLIDSNGAMLPTEPAMGLCRCGESKNKPFCDGSHKESGFDDTRSPERTADKRQDYVGQHITIHNNVLLCSHSERCVKNLGSVFNIHNTPWIDPDGDSVDKVRAVINSCPSGALSYSIDGEAPPIMERPPTIEIEKNGPYRVTGGIELNNADWGEGASREHYTLCRCGASKNKPFCDGTHVQFQFDDAH